METSKQDADEETSTSPAVERGIGGGVGGLAVELNDDETSVQEGVRKAELSPMGISDVALGTMPIATFVAFQIAGYPTIGIIAMVTMLLTIAFWAGRPN